MSELDQLTHLIDGILGTDNQVRKNNEALLQNLRDKDFNQYIFAFGNLLKASSRSEVIVFCLAHVRRLLSNFVEGEDGKWHVLHPENQKFQKETLLELLKKDQHPNARKVLCDYIGELASTIDTLKEEEKQQMAKEGTEWPELMQTVWGLLNSGNTDYMENALRIMAVLFANCGPKYADYKDELLPVLSQTLIHQSPAVSIGTMEALACFIENVDFKTCKIFLPLMSMMLNQVLVIVKQSEDSGLDALAAVADILDAEPRMFKKDVKQLIETFKVLIKSDIEAHLKQATMETMILSIERLPRTYSSDMQQIKEIAELIFAYMIASDEEPDEEWLNPPDGYVEVITDDDAHDSAIRFSMGLIDRIIRSLSKKSTLSLFSQLILEMVKQNNWKYQHCALMSLSQVGEYIDDMAEFDPIITFVLNFLQSDHPKVRYAALHVLGQSAEDCKPFFQKRFGDTIFPHLITMYNDFVPRVAYHGLNATANLLEQCPKEIANKYAVKILEPCIHFISNAKSFLKESALTVVGNLAESCEADFTPYWQKTSEVIFTVLNTTQKEYKNVRGQAIEALSLIGEAVGRTEFKKVCHNVIQKMVEIQTNDLGKMDPQNVFVLSSWHRVCSTLQSDFIPYLSFVMQPIFKLVDEIIKAEEEQNEALLNDENEKAIVTRTLRNKQLANDEEEKDKKGLFYNVNTSQSDEVATAVKMMRGFASELKAGYLPYVEKTSEIFVHLMANSENGEVKKEAADSLVDLIICVQESNHPNKDTIIRAMHNTYLENLWETVWEELDAEMMRGYVDIMMEIIVKSGRIMTEQELNQFNECVLKTLALSDERKTDNLKFKEENPEEFDEDDEEMVEESNKLEEELHLALAELIGTLFRVYKELTMPLVKLIYNQILPKVLSPEFTPAMNKFGLFLIDDMIEHLGIELIPEEWPHLSEALIKYGAHPDIEVRTAAIYGIGALGQNSKDVFINMADVCMKVMYEAIEMKRKPADDPEEFGSSHDNMIGALGKLIKSQYSAINLKEAVRVWLSYLPLKYDLDEGKIQHELLVDIILESDAALVFGDNGENLPKVIKVLAEVVNTKASSEGFRGKVVKVIQLLAGNETTKTLLQNAIANLDVKLQTKLKEVMDS